MKFRLYKQRPAAQVKVPLATPEIIELNEIIATPFSIQDYYETSSPLLDNNRENISKVTDSSVDSSSDERIQTSSTPIQNIVPLQRKVSDRKIKRARAKQNDVTGSTSSSEVLKKRKYFIFLFLYVKKFKLLL